MDNERDHSVVSRTNPVKDNTSSHSVLYIVQKTQKLTSVLYKISNFLSEQDVLKWKLRHHAVELLLTISSLGTIHTVEEAGDVVRKSRAHIEQIISLLEVSFSVGGISEMNFSILKDEYKGLHDVLEENVREINQKDIFKKDKYKRQAGIGHISHQMSDKAITMPRIVRVQVQDKKREQILNYVKARGESTIKDIISLPELTDMYSEKTIQRELSAMVSEGILKKKGERRWSVYFL
jgi:predicted O-linked N-acetylglucosamine transferase (SPINDLY family)